MAQVTLKDVARVAEVHFTTVSLALRGHPSIPEATRERIRRTAERLGYVPNPVYQALTRRRQKSAEAARPPALAYIANRPPELGFDALPHHRHFLAAGRAQAEALGYRLELLFLSDDHYASDSLAAYLEREKIEGVVLAALEPGFANPVLDWSRLAVVKIDSEHIEPAATLVTHNQEQGVRLAFRRMWELGYRRIGVAVGRSDEDCTSRRATSGLFLEQAALAPEQRVPPLLFPYNTSGPDAAGLVGRWVRRHRVDAVLCNWSNVDLICQEAGLRVPDEVACAGLCLCEPMPGAAGVVTNMGVVGREAVSTLARLLRSGQRGLPEYPVRTFIEGYWQDGPTAPARTETASHYGAVA
jgi:LacI family transcriptional regulator